MSAPGPLVALVGDAAEARSAPAAWARCVARSLGGEVLALPPAAGMARVLDQLAKRDVRWLVRGLASEAHGAPTAAIPGERALGALLRRAPCPALCVQPWALPPAGPPRVAVVGVDRSAQSRRVAEAAAALLAGSGAPARLILAHGTAEHPDSLATATPWPELLDSMRPERKPWVRELARELRRDEVLVEVAVALRWAPDWISGLARRQGADFVALGLRGCAEGERAPLGAIHRRVLRGGVWPVATSL